MRILAATAACAALAAGLAMIGPVPVAIAAGSPTVADLRHARRVLVVSASGPQDRAFRRQMQQLAGGRAGRAARDITPVTIIGDRVSGAGDSAPALRQRLDLPHDRFAVTLIGKDGHQALRSARPLSSASLERTIDAMPMRRAGYR